MALSVLGALGIGAGLNFLNNVLAVGNAERQAGLSVDSSKQLFDYQWNKAGSPQAQVKNLASAGINPVSQFGSGSADIVGGSMPSVSPQPIQMSAGVDSLRELTGAEKDVADIKKTGADTTKVENEIESVKLSNEMQTLQNQIAKEYGMPKAAKELALAAEHIKLAQQQGDLNDVEKAIKKWSEVKERAISMAEEHKRDILKMELDNTEKRLDLANKESEARVNASNAAAVASSASASLSYSQKKTEDTLRQWRMSLTKNQAAELYHKIKNLDVSTEATAVDALRKLTGLSDAPWTQVYNDIKKATGVVKADDILEYLEYHGFKLPGKSY